MKIALFNSKPYDQHFFDLENNSFNHNIRYFETHLNASTASLAEGFEGVCAFVNDQIDRACLEVLAKIKTKIIALRCAGFNNVDLQAAQELGIHVVRVPEYSPHGVAEHALTLIQALNRKIYKAYNRVRESNFSLEGLLGFNLNSKTVGVIGSGKIGAVFCKIMLGFGCKVLAYDVKSNEDLIKLGVDYVSLEKLYQESDIISLHCPLTPETHHLIDDSAINQMKEGVMLINTSRGALIDTVAIIKHLKSKKIASLGLDVYEEEGDLFFEDISDKILEDDIFARLLTFPNVLITGHQAFFTEEALRNIANTSLENFDHFEKEGTCINEVTSTLINSKPNK